MSTWKDKFEEMHPTTKSIKKLKLQLNKMKSKKIKRLVENSILDPFYK
jgi:hypothetical protein